MNNIKDNITIEHSTYYILYSLIVYSIGHLIYLSVLNCSVISITISLPHNTYDVYKIQLNFNIIKYIKSLLILVFVILFSLVDYQKTLYICKSYLHSTRTY